MKFPIYKSREEDILMQHLSESQLISKGQLIEIKKLYDEEVPYHNFVHALNVAHRVLMLPKENFTITEIQSLFIAALFHDAGHSGVVSELDEFRSLDLAFEGISNFEKKYDYKGIDLSIVRKSIIGTVFKNRYSNTDKYAILMADLDVSILGMSFPEFLYYNDFPFSIECGIDIDTWIKDVNFFKFLTSIDKNVFRNEVIREIFPEYLRNIKTYLGISSKEVNSLYKYWRDNDITFDEFEKFYKNYHIVAHLGK